MRLVEQVHTLIIVSNEVLNEPIGDNEFVIRLSSLIRQITSINC